MISLRDLGFFSLEMRRLRGELKDLESFRQRPEQAGLNTIPILLSRKRLDQMASCDPFQPK